MIFRNFCRLKELVKTSASTPLKSNYFTEIVQIRSASDSTVIFSPFTTFDVLIKPPNLISVFAGIDRTQIYRTLDNSKLHSHGGS